MLQGDIPVLEVLFEVLPYLPSVPQKAFGSEKEGTWVPLEWLDP